MADLIGVFALIIGLELVLGVDNILVITILVSRLEEKYQQRNKLCHCNYSSWRIGYIFIFHLAFTLIKLILTIYLR